MGAENILKAVGGALQGIGKAAQQNANLQNGGPMQTFDFSAPNKDEDKEGILTTIGNKMEEGKGKDFMLKAEKTLSKFSDERLKELFEDDDRIDCLARVNSYDFTYKPEAQKGLGVDGLEHTGIIVQELEDNPSFKGCTTKDPESGFGMVKIPELTMSNTAGLGDLARGYENLEARVAELERIIGDR